MMPKVNKLIKDLPFSSSPRSTLKVTCYTEQSAVREKGRRQKFRSIFFLKKNKTPTYVCFCEFFQIFKKIFLQNIYG